MTLNKTKNDMQTLIAPDGFRHLFVSDLDGTLLDDCSRISPATAEILSWLGHRGVMFTVATARTPATVDPMLNNFFTFLPAIVMTGAAMWDRQNKRYESCHFFDKDIAEGIFQTCLANGIHPFMYRFDGADNNLLRVYHSKLLLPKEREFLDERRHLPLKRFHLVDDASVDEMPTDNVVLFFTIGNRDAIFHAANDIRTRFICSVSCYPDILNRDMAIMELLPPDVSKGAAITQLAKKVGAEKITVFGDNFNDLPMMEIADTSVAVSNAQQKVIDNADIIIGRNTTDSVARYILKFYTGLDYLI